VHFITGKHLPRRTFLKAAGATVALPFLESMVPAAAFRVKAASANDYRMSSFILGVIKSDAFLMKRVEVQTTTEDRQGR